MSHSMEASSRKLKYVDPVSFTPHFKWEKSGVRSATGEEVVCERVPLSSVAKKVGTPTYLYSRAAIDDAYKELHKGLGALPHTLCFAVKSNGNLSILNHLARLGSGFDIVSAGELHNLQRIGVRGERIVFSGVGKDRHEIREALNYRVRERGRRSGILLFNTESEAELDILMEEAGRLAGFIGELRREQIDLRYLDVGGGLGVRYSDQNPPTRTEYARLVSRMVRKLGVHLLLEPGRSIIAPAGVLLTRVLYTKTNRGKTFVVVDSAMNDLMLPALYGAVHPITKVTRERNEGDSGRQRADIVGPVCETGDCFLRDWPLGDVQAGDLLAIWVTGAYGMSQASNYNARCRPAEVLVEGNRFKLIRLRETHNDLLRNDVLV